MEWLFFWFVLSVAVGLAAGKRGRGSGTWFVVCLLISPVLGALILWSLPDASGASVSERTHRACPACAEQVLRAATVCKHCGTAITPAPYAETTWDKLTKMR